MHQIVFRNVTNGWYNALPIGNGKIGAMIFFQDRALHVALNHYDCYYGILPKRGGEESGQDGDGRTFADPARKVQTYEELCRLTEEAKGRTEAAAYGETHYLRTLHPGQVEGRPSYRGTSYPMGGEVVLSLGDEVDAEECCLRLEIEKGRICFQAGRQERVKAVFFIPEEEDGVVMRLSQTKGGLWKKGGLLIPSRVGLGYCETRLLNGADRVCLRTVYQKNGGRAGKMAGHEASLYIPGGRAGEEGELYFPGDFREMAVCAVLEPEDPGAEKAEPEKAEPEGMATEVMKLEKPLWKTGKAETLQVRLVRDADALEASHAAGWAGFWRSCVALPDKFLETLWHLHVYLMGCSYGRGKYPEQACGLSGLWDIRRPNMWGSMWYWDVNIQSAFWGTASGGHPELLKVFCDGYLEYEQDIRRYTRQVYGFDGWALDYPHPLYNCIQPWCAGGLWEYFTYTKDMEFLELKAYPVFREQAAFFRHIAKEGGDGKLHVEPDISPEQGPVTRDSVITIACIKKLLKAGIEAAALLNRPEEERREMEELLSGLPAYARTGDGVRWKDSALAREDVFLRHPSALMPIFPAGEITPSGNPSERRAAEETLRYAAENTEIGTFGAGWLASAAAALGNGDAAMQLLYEKGLDYTLHSNGLCYEESERFVNYCHVTKPAHYLPAMCEAFGGIVSAVNLMLLGTGEAVEVFPAVPSGKEALAGGELQYWEDRQCRKDAQSPADGRRGGGFGCWENVGFQGLTAPGGFRISAQRRGGKTVFLEVESTTDALLRLILPEELTGRQTEGEEGKLCKSGAGEPGAGEVLVYEKNMRAGERLVWGTDTGMREAVEVMEGAEDMEDGPEVLVHEAARTSRRVFLGEDRHTAFFKAVDAFVCPYGFADSRRYTMTPYVFDFGMKDTVKNYDNVYPRQTYRLQRCILSCAGPKRAGAECYDEDRGYGFRQTEGIRAADRGKPDDMRRDFLEGEGCAEFLLDLPAGKYDLLVISGDEEESSHTSVSLPQYGTSLKGERLAAGRYQCRVLPVMHERDGLLVLRMENGEGEKWKLNGVFVNKEYALL